jgi:hypothetical protein
MKKLPSRSFRPSIESLEERQLLAGNVAAFVTPSVFGLGGDLYIKEAAGQAGRRSAIQISQLPNGNIRVKGIEHAEGTTLVNGAQFRDFKVRGDLRINLGGGGDLVRLQPNAKFNGVTINLGGPSGSNVEDIDMVNADRITTRGSMTIDTGRDSDYVYVKGCRIGDSGGDNLTIRTGAGTDDVQVTDLDRFTDVRGILNVRTFNTTEDERDTVLMRNVLVRKDITTSLGGGADTLTMIGVTAAGDIILATGEGDDRGTLNSVWALDDMTVFMRGGNDTLDVMYLRADELWLDGGPGYDLLSKSVDGQSRTLAETNWEPLLLL